MSLKVKFLVFILIVLLYSCADYNAGKSTPKKIKQYYSSRGFALIYDEIFYIDKVISKKINNDEIIVMHNKLKKNTPVKIINPENSKIIDTKIFKKANYPNIFNAVVSKKIASILELDADNPYIEIVETKKNKTFIAKEGNTFEEEKKVADKAPVNQIKMDDLTKKDYKVEKSEVKKNFILVISDFYYVDTANNLKKDLLKKININNISVKKINNKKYRLLVGPFENFNALKNTYISLNKLGFAGLNIYKE